jgi:hypothetical protein
MNSAPACALIALPYRLRNGEQAANREGQDRRARISATQSEETKMAVSQNRIDALDAISRAVADLFPDGVQFTRKEEAERNFIACWPLAGQPEQFSQISREVSVRFSEPFLRRYEEFSEAERAVAHPHIRAFIQANREGYSEGREVPRGGLKEPFVIDASHEFFA